jgi:hypothetical protein
MSAIPGLYNFNDHYKGSTFSPLNVKFNFDITGAVIVCQIKKEIEAVVIHEWKTGDNITVVDLETGEIVLEQIDEFNASAGVYQYDLQIKFVDGTCQTYIKGTVKVIDDISKVV